MFSLLLNIAYAFLGSFVIIFQMLSQGVYETEGEAGPNNKISCSIKVTNWSTGTLTALSAGALPMFSDPFQKRDKGPITSKIFS